MDVSFGTIWEAIARDQPDSVAISEPGRDYTFAEFDDRSARLAAALAAAGVGPGDKVACYLYNGAAYLETVFAAFKLGAVPVNANYRYTQDELTALLADADAAALVFSGDLAANVTHAARTLPSLRLLVRVGESSPGSRAGRARACGPVRRDRAAPGRAAPRRRSALHVHRRHDRQAEGGDLASGRPAAVDAGLGVPAARGARSRRARSTRSSRSPGPPGPATGRR